MRRCAVVALALACAGWPAPARGSEVSSAELRALATAAQRDPDALAELREVDVVDGRRAAVGAALTGAERDVRARLRALAQAATGAPATSASAARTRARAVLAQRRFRSTSIGAPLRGVRERIGEGVRAVGRPFARAFEWVAGWLPGGHSVLWALLAGAVLATSVALGLRAGARRSLAAASAAAGDRTRERSSVAQLLRAAERAERDGDLHAALRLRFRAGLLDLDRRALVELRPGLTNHELLRDVPSPTLAGLVDSFEEVAYGGRAAAPGDVRDARDGWPRVPEEAAAP